MAFRQSGIVHRFPFRPILLGLLLALAAVPPGPAATIAMTPTQALMQELRVRLTLHGKPVPPEVFRDLGDGSLADSDSIWVTIDLLAAIGSNLYADEIKPLGEWVTQTRAADKERLSEETAYRYIGATPNGLLVAIASYNGGGSGTFYTLHILDASLGHGFDNDGRRTDRVNLTAVRSVALGDRWKGTVRLVGNSIEVTTTGGLPVGVSHSPTTRTIEARRP